MHSKCHILGSTTTPIAYLGQLPLIKHFDQIYTGICCEFFFGISLPVFQTGSFNMAWPSRKNIFWKFRQSRQEGGVVGEWGAESGKCATILCAHINAVRGNCARSHYEPSLTCEQWDHSASFASTRCLARKGQNKSRSLFPTSNI